MDAGVGSDEPIAALHLTQMAEQNAEPHAEQKPGTGVDRTLIHQLLELTPSERIKMAVREANNLARLVEKMRIR